jgi:hypothetical protein
VSHLEKVVAGREYVFISNHPPGRQGCVYRVEEFVISVPSYQTQVLFRGVTGPDTGRAFCCSLWNFACRYEPVPPPEPPPPAAVVKPKEKPVERAAGYVSEPWRTVV